MSLGRNAALVPTLWRLSQFALAEVEALDTAFEKHWVCWHFTPSNPDGDEIWDVDHPFLSNAVSLIEERFPDALPDIVGGPFGIEIYEKVRPDRDWLCQRLSHMALFADETGFDLDGWSYEPQPSPPFGYPQAFLERYGPPLRKTLEVGWFANPSRYPSSLETYASGYRPSDVELQTLQAEELRRFNAQTH